MFICNYKLLHILSRYREHKGGSVRDIMKPPPQPPSAAGWLGWRLGWHSIKHLQQIMTNRKKYHTYLLKINFDW